eukprot:a682716_55.p1 GENE.a682716_55~~a682716_55.p1  ORF type:complete len:233 (+),score=69.60 a682716_55:35-700(+)
MGKWKKPRVRYALGATTQSTKEAAAAAAAADVAPNSETVSTEELLKQAAGTESRLVAPALFGALPKSSWDQPASKRDRRRLKHEAFVERLQLDAAARAPRDALKLDAMESTLGALAQAIDAEDERKAAIAATGRLSASAKRKLVEKESAHFQAVMEHPAFLHDPIGTLEAHVFAVADASKKPRAHHAAKAAAAAKAKAKGKANPMRSGKGSLKPKPAGRSR